MAITSYSELKSAIQNWAARSDTTFTDRIDEFIDLCEDRIHYGSGEEGQPYYSEPLRVRGMITSSDLAINAQSVSQPTGLLELIRIYLSTDPKVDLTYMTPDRFWSANINAVSTTGKPISYTIEGENFVFGPSPDATYTGKLLYYKKLDALSVSNTTNWLITNTPAIYLYGSLLEYAIWEQDNESALKYAGLYSARLNALISQDKRSRHGNHPRVMVDSVDGSTGTQIVTS